MSLYKKYRPQNLEEIIGNQETVASISDMLVDPISCPHSFLLTGQTGCGKTTLARIIADQLGSQGRDFREIDSAEDRGIDGIRRIIKLSQYKPIESDRIVWLLDECHKLTNDAQNALLKILEDTPKHVYFILCTTDPVKLLKTIKGRCSTFEMNPFSESQMMKLLRKVVKAEGQTMSKTVYEQIIQDSLGLPRNALQVLDQVIRIDSDDQLAAASKAAENISQSIDLCRLLIKGAGWKRVAEILRGLKDEQPETIRRHVLGYCQSILLKEDNVRAGLVMEEMINPFYNTGYPGLVFACYSVIKDDTSY